MEDVVHFKSWIVLKNFELGDTVIKDDVRGTIKDIIFAHCYWVLWENGEESHAYHHELKKQ